MLCLFNSGYDYILEDIPTPNFDRGDFLGEFKLDGTITLHKTRNVI